MRRWSPQEESRLCAAYEKTPFPNLVEMFPERTPLSIRKKANKMGLEADWSARFQHLSPWDDKALSVLVDWYPSGVPVDQIAEEAGVSARAVYRKASQMGLDRDRRKFEVNDHFFDRWTEASSYWTGFIAADGCLREESKSVVIQLAEKDRPHLEALNAALQPDRPVLHDTERGRATAVIRSDRIYARMCEIGLTPRKSLSLVFPAVAEEQVHHFIRGYFDGDGTSYHRGKCGKICFGMLGTEAFLSVAAVHLPGNMKPRPRKGESIWRIQATGTGAERVFEYLYRDATIYLGRKRII